MNKQDRTMKCSGDCASCGRCQGANVLRDAHGRKTKLMQFPAGFSPDLQHPGTGIAFDLGTTTIVAMLWDLATGKNLGISACTNPQGTHGADVISRITYCGQDPAHLTELRELVLSGMRGLAEGLCTAAGKTLEEVTHVVCGGNTTMSHVFAGYDPQSLARAPFAPAYTGLLDLSAEAFPGLGMNNASILLLPNIAGHVGGDITAGILATGLLEATELTLMLDIGTNGEIVLAAPGRVLTCSTAAGPAFEGATILHGMRAADGAIETIRIREGEVYIKTIAQTEPVGICGSGIIDAIAEMIAAGLINPKGRLASAEEFERQNPGSPLTSRLISTEEGREFVLMQKQDGGTITVTQKDIREVQLAKGAMAAGIDILLECMGRKREDIRRILIAGAFGNYIHKESALGIGLIPKRPVSTILSAGNTAGAGVSMVLLGSEVREKMMAVPEEVEHVELASWKNFQDVYMNSLAF